jgi:hypothetical protein
MTQLRRSIAAAVATLVLPFAARAQTMRGVVVDAGDRPVAGAVVLLLDSASTVAARGLTNERGEFRLAGPRAGTYRVRTLRIGYRPVVSDPEPLLSGGEVTKRLVLTSVAIALDTIRVVDRAACRPLGGDTAATIFTVWDQARTALTATQLTAAARTISATTVTYQRTLDPSTGRPADRVRQQDARIRSEYVTQPWRSLSPDSLLRGGYVVTGNDNSVTYNAPGLDALIANAFVEDHCFKLVTDRRHANQLGIAFEPVESRKRIAEIRGTVWLDRASSELRSLDFKYANVSFEQEDVAGGNLEFVHMTNGAWVITRWSIRMPLVEQVVRRGYGAELRVAEVHVAGGDLVLARRGTDTLWSRPPLVLTGTVVDSASGRAVSNAKVSLHGSQLEGVSDANGRFTINGVLPGEYTVDVRTPSLDSANAVHQSTVVVTDANTHIQVRAPTAAQVQALVCGQRQLAGPGIVVGSLSLRGDTTRPKNVIVSAQWTDLGVRDVRAGAQVERQPHRLETRSAPDGSFRLCGVPVNTALTIRATADSTATAEANDVTIPGEKRFARVDLELRAAVGAVFHGLVVTDSTAAPISLAEVALPDIGKVATTDERGTFRIDGISAGTHRVVIRRIGFGPAETQVSFGTNQVVERRVVLGRAVTLEPVTVTSKALERRMAEFDENRRLGLGHFYTRAELAKLEGRRMSEALYQLPGLGIVPGTGSQGWVMGRRAIAPCPDPSDVACMRQSGIYIPEGHEARMGMKPSCYAQVYVDDLLMNPTSPTEPFDVNTLSPERIEAIEWYAGPSQTPLKYSKWNSKCGVLILWTRRS